MSTSSDPHLVENVPFQEAQISDSRSDLPFWGFITGSLGVGTIISVTSVPPLVPSFFFGVTASMLVHRFLGGISPKDSTISVGNIGKLGGVLASLVLTTMVFNSALEKQKTKILLTTEPGKDSLVILDSDQGLPTEIKLYAKNDLGKEEEAIPINQYALNKIKEICRENAGFCKEQPIATQFSIDSNLKKGFAIMCENRLNGYRLTINGKNTKNPANVKAYFTDECPIGVDKGYMLMKISQEDAEKANIENHTSGTAEILSLRTLTPHSGMYKTALLENALNQGK